VSEQVVYALRRGVAWALGVDHLDRPVEACQRDRGGESCCTTSDHDDITLDIPVLDIAVL